MRKGSLKRLLDAEPELDGIIAIDGLGDVEAQRRAFDQAEPVDVDAEAGADGVGGGAERLAGDVGVADVVERGEVDVADAADVIDEVPVSVRAEGHAPFDAADPEHVPLAFAE